MASKSKSNRSSRKQSPDGSELLVLELQEIHSAENQLARVMPRLAKTVQSDKLRQMLEQRLSEGERVLKDVDDALEAMEQSPGRKKNVAAEGLINDAREHAQEIEAGPALDCVLIGATQKLEHYCIAAWGTAKAIGQATGQKNLVKAMDRALEEGKSFDEQLTQLSEKEVMPALLSQGEGMEDEDEDAEQAELDDEDDTEDQGTAGSRRSRNGGNERRASGRGSSRSSK